VVHEKCLGVILLHQFSSLMYFPRACHSPFAHTAGAITERDFTPHTQQGSLGSELKRAQPARYKRAHVRTGTSTHLGEQFVTVQFRNAPLEGETHARVCVCVLMYAHI
jgi:hypothetical protein